jgi:hypothetical protein
MASANARLNKHEVAQERQRRDTQAASGSSESGGALSRAIYMVSLPLQHCRSPAMSGLLRSGDTACLDTQNQSSSTLVCCRTSHRNRFCGLGRVSQTVFGTKVEIAFTETGLVRRLLSCRTFWQRPLNETEAETVSSAGKNLARETGSTQGTRKGPMDHKAS